jgi:hypothetical protein
LVEKHFQERTVEPQISPLRSFPGFPVDAQGFDDLHAALFKESRIRGLRWHSEVGNPGTLCRKTFPRMSIHTEISPLRFASVEMTKERGGASSGEKLLNRSLFSSS